MSGCLRRLSALYGNVAGNYAALDYALIPHLCMIRSRFRCDATLRAASGANNSDDPEPHSGVAKFSGGCDGYVKRVREQFEQVPCMSCVRPLGPQSAHNHLSRVVSASLAVGGYPPTDSNKS